MAVAISSSQLLITAPQLGQLLVSTRKRRKLTQAAVAIRVGLSQNRISHLENPPDEISFKQLLSWCSVLELKLRLWGYFCVNLHGGVVVNRGRDVLHQGMDTWSDESLPSDADICWSAEQSIGRLVPGEKLYKKTA